MDVKLKPYYQSSHGTIFNGSALDILKQMPDESVNCCVTSPPYWGLRDYGVDGQLGLEPTPEQYVENMVLVFREVKRVLRSDGTLWLNLGDSYAGSWGNAGHREQLDGGTSVQRERTSDYIHRVGFDNHRIAPPGSNPKTIGLKQKDLVGIPWLVAFALRSDGWYLRQDIIWHKPNPMPESVTDRCTKSHEYIFLMSKSQKYFYDHEAIQEKSVEHIRKREKYNGESAVDTKLRGFDSNCGCSGVRNKRSVWTVTTKPFKEAHFAVFPPKLIEPCILAGCPKGGTVLDPFFGSGTTGLVAYDHDRKFTGIELNPDYCAMAKKRIEKETQQLKLFGT